MFCVVGGVGAGCVVLLQDYERALDMMRDIILATDLAHHLGIMKELEAMVQGAYTCRAGCVGC